MRYIIKTKVIFLNILCASFLLTSCVQDNLDPDNAPGVGEVVDLTPPEAIFSSQQNSVDFLKFLFINESVSATGQTWTIPEGAVLDGEDATLNDLNITVIFPSEGSFEVGLVAQDNKPSSSEMFVQLIEVAEPLIPIIPVPEILAAGFEDFDGIDGRDPWRFSGAKVFGRSTGSRVRTGQHSAKFEDVDLRQAYQEIEVTPNTNYLIEAYIRIGNSGGILAGNEDEFRLAVVGESFTAFDLVALEGAFITSKTFDPIFEEFQRVFVTFNSGDRETVGIYMDTKGVVETQVDDVAIQVL